jgi:hypothetical protein
VTAFCRKNEQARAELKGKMCDPELLKIAVMNKEQSRLHGCSGLIYAKIKSNQS